MEIDDERALRAHWRSVMSRAYELIEPDKGSPGCYDTFTMMRTVEKLTEIIESGKEKENLNSDFLEHVRLMSEQYQSWPDWKKKAFVDLGDENEKET